MLKMTSTLNWVKSAQRLNHRKPNLAFHRMGPNPNKNGPSFLGRASDHYVTDYYFGTSINRKLLWKSFAYTTVRTYDFTAEHRAHFPFFSRKNESMEENKHCLKNHERPLQYVPGRCPLLLDQLESLRCPVDVPTSTGFSLEHTLYGSIQ